MMFKYPSPLWRLRSFFGAILLVSSVVAWSPIVLFFALTKNREKTTRCIRLWNRFALWSFDVQIKTHFNSEYSATDPCLIVSNHQSHLDIPIVFDVLDGHIRMLAKKELFHIPLFGQCLSAAEFIPIDRGNRKAGMQAIQKIRERVQSGIQIWVAPEGTRSSDGKLQEFKSGSFAVAIENEIPIQPIVVKGAIKALSKKDIFPKPGMTIDFYVLPQISTKGLNPEDRHALAKQTQKAIGDILES